MNSIKRFASLSVLALALLSVSSSQAFAYAYSSWWNGTIRFGPAGSTWIGWNSPILTSPQGTRSYMCQEFGFYNCGVAPADTWTQSAVLCYSGTVGSSSSTWAYGPWSQTYSRASCPAGYPNASTDGWVMVASNTYSNYSYLP